MKCVMEVTYLLYILSTIDWYLDNSEEKKMCFFAPVLTFLFTPKMFTPSVFIYYL